MLTREQVEDAYLYNRKNAIHFRVMGELLQWPFTEGFESYRFVWITALFQSEHGLTVDGKLGPDTWKAFHESKHKAAAESALVADSLSNCIIVNGKRVKLPDEALAQGLEASNYLDDGEPRFRRRDRTAALEHFVLHETCGNTAKGCKDTLLRKGYGVQLILDPTGKLSCHGDLVLDRMVHANQLNNSSFGIEVINPYSPLYARPPFTNAIPREWWTWVPRGEKYDILAEKRGWSSIPKKYVTPTDKQMEAARILVPWLCSVTGVQYRFPTKGLGPGGKRKIDNWNVKPRGKPGPGVVAHRDFASHADGRYMLEDLIRRAQ